MSTYEKLLQRIRKIDKDLSFDELLLVLKKNGYNVRNNGSSHYFFSKPNAYGVTIPRHKPMKVFYIKMVKEVLEREGIL